MNGNEILNAYMHAGMQQIPIWWRWYYWASPVGWTPYSFVTFQVGDRNSALVTVKAYLKDILGYDHDFLPVVAAAHLGLVLLFLFVIAFAIKFLNFQKI